MSLSSFFFLLHLSQFSWKIFRHDSVMRQQIENRREKKLGTKVKRGVRKLRIGIEKNDRRRRMNIRGGEERDSSLLVPRASRRTLLVETMRTFPLPRPKCSFPFPTCLPFSLPRPSRPSLSSRLILLSLIVISVFSRACILPSSYTYVRRLSDHGSRVLEYMVSGTAE